MEPTVLDKVLCHLIIFLAHELQVQGGTIAHFVVNIVQASRQQNLDTSLDVRVLLADAKLGQSSNSSSSHNGILKDDAVIDVTDVLGWLSSLRTLQTNKVKDTDGQLRKLAILDEFAQMSQSLILGVRNELDQIEHALHDGTLELVSTLIAQNATEEGQHAGLLAGELQAQSSDSLDNSNLELVGNLRHEARDLLHQSVNTGLVTGLEKGGDGECSNRAVSVGNEELDIGIAHADGAGLEGGKVVEDSESGKLGDGSGGGEEHLEDVDGLGNFVVGDVAHVANSLGGLEVDHFALVSQPAIDQLHHWLAKRHILLGQLGSKSDQQDGGGGVLDRTSGTKLLNHLDESHPVVRSHLVEETNGMVLGHGRVVHGHLSARGRKSQRETAGRLGRGSSLLSLALPASDDILGDGQKVIRGN